MSTATDRPVIRAVIFDLGGVLLGHDIRPALAAYGKAAGLSPFDVGLRLTTNVALMDAFECGRISDRQFHARLAEILGGSLTYEFFIELWNGVFTGEIAPTLDAARRLRAMPGMKVAILSNTNSLHFDHLTGSLPWLGEFEHVFASHRIGCRKPNAAAYEHTLCALDVKAENAVFIDDMIENVEGARSAGLHGIHAPKPQAALAGLAALGLG